MPLVKRQIQPVYVSRVKLEKGLVNEFECVSVSTLSGIIRQISSLAKYSEDVFDEILHEAKSIQMRATSLQGRISGLAEKVTQLDSNVEETSLQDINIKKTFKLTVNTDQQVVGRATLPKSMAERYTACDAPPRLQDMNLYREDGKDALKFYTDPTYFFELWREEMNKEPKKKKKRQHRGGRKQSQVRVKHLRKKVYDGQDKEFSQSKYSVEDSVPSTQDDIKPPVQNGSVHLNTHEFIKYDERRGTASSRRGTTSKPKPTTKPPPPPPVPSQIDPNLPLPPPPPSIIPPNMSSDMPPPPPPPAFPGMNSPVAPPPPPLPPPTPPPPVEGGMTAPPPEPKKLDARTDLLEAIRTGMKLRKVQGETEKKEQQNVGMDVASILQRRIAVEYSDSESETGSEWDDDDDDWQDEDED